MSGRRTALGAVGLVLGLLVAGTTIASAADPLVSRGRAVTASSIEGPGFEAGKAVDGSTSTRWASVEGHDPEWLRVDLGSAHRISRVKLNWEVAYARSYRVQTSPDGSAWADVYSTSTGDGGTDDLTVSGSGRYVRVYGTARGTPYGYSLWEFEVYGVDGGTPPTSTTTPPPPSGLGYPFGSRQTPYAAGILRPSGSTSTLDAKIVDYYQKWKAAFVKQNCGNGWYQIISPDAKFPYVAEAQGYGMVITATMAGADPDAKKIFDGLLKYKLAHPSVNNPDLLAAEQDPACRSVNGSDSATDGDMDTAYGLLLADRQWGSSGTYNYRQIAVRNINAIKKSLVNPNTNLLLMGDWSGPGDSRKYYGSRSSDWMADHFRAFRKATGDSAWDTIRAKHQDLIALLQSKYAAGTGLLPDFVQDTNSTVKPAVGEMLERADTDGKYWYNACRDPWRIGADAALTGDARSLAAARKMNSWIKGKTGGDPNRIGVGYQLNGTQIASGSDSAFVAPFAVAATTDAGSQAWLDALWNKMVNTPVGTNTYFGASIQLQVMITVSGNHWIP